MSLRDAAQQALKMLKRGVSFNPGWVPDCEDAIAALEAALAEPQPEPVAPPQRQPLTDEQITAIWAQLYPGAPLTRLALKIVRAVEAHHGIGGDK